MATPVQFEPARRGLQPAATRCPDVEDDARCRAARELPREMLDFWRRQDALSELGAWG